MANFKGNFKNQGPPGLCPLCGTHEDLQELCFQCPTVQKNIEITESYEKIFSKLISEKLARNLMEITKLQNKESAVPARVPDVHHHVPVADGCCKPCTSNIVT